MAAGETFSGPFIVSVRRASGENRQGERTTRHRCSGRSCWCESAHLRILHALECRMSNLDKPVAIHILGKTFANQFARNSSMNKTAQITNSALVFLVLLCLTTKAMAGQSITQVKVNQITRGLTTEEDLIRAFGPAATKTVCPPGQVTLDWFYASPISAQNYIPFFGPALGGAQVKAWELWVVLRANGTVKRYIAYRHYVNGETRRYVERSDYHSER